jgi:hypothetical protein
VSDADDRYPRRTFTLDPKANDLLEQLARDTGKGFSEIICLGLLSLEGDRKMLRHALGQPLNALRLNCNLLASMHPGDEPLHQTIREQFQRVEQALAPPVVKTPTA